MSLWLTKLDSLLDANIDVYAISIIDAEAANVCGYLSYNLFANICLFDFCINGSSHT